MKFQNQVNKQLDWFSTEFMNEYKIISLKIEPDQTWATVSLGLQTTSNPKLKSSKDNRTRKHLHCNMYCLLHVLVLCIEQFLPPS